jgi:cytochrome c-type biogenesis protein CcsB
MLFNALPSEMTLVHGGMVFLIASLFGYLAWAWTRKGWVHQLAWASMAVSAMALVAAIAVRSVEAGYFALSNMYESLMVLILWLQVGFLVLDKRYHLPALGWVACLMLITALAYDLTLPTTIKPLQAALQSYWRAIHVPVIILSYAMFTLAFLSSIIYLVQGWMGLNKGLTLSAAGGAPLESTAAPSLMAANTTDAITKAEATLPKSNGELAQIMAAEAAGVRPFNLYDEITYRCIAVGFPLLIGIVLGGLWANEAWGNYWSWDPKESMSLVTLLGYGVYLHLRVNGRHTPNVLSWVSVAGFVLMLVTYFGVNLMGVGLHSYGKIG